jgi:prevent-host-death family protein
MRTATVREVQHGLASVLSQVQKGQEIAVTKHGKVIARIVPATRAKGRLRWPDSAIRMKQLMSGATLAGAAPSEIIRELRGERV